MVLVTMLWSTAGVVARQLEYARSFEVTFWRSLFTFLCLSLLLPLLQGPRFWSGLRTAGRAFWVSGVCWSVMFTAFMVALTLTSVGNVLITMAIGPLLTALVARVFIGHHVATRTWFAIAAAGAGIAYMYATQLDTLSWAGTLVALCVPIAGATNWTVTQHAHEQGHDVDLVPAVWVGGALSSLVTLPLAYPFQASGHDVLLLGGLGVFQLAIPCALSVVCARVLKAPEVSLLALLEVIFGILLAWLGAGETPTHSVLLGGAVVIGALLVNEWLGWRER
ncbi:DMT family transporter [Curvibacter sp. APW13]|uniref:DMT family transporter n=1 Tax=Curvibacter sp. APW13 TaxID=3077236 RepID=UPI0028DFD87C|nr:DMT family transporter [Curvibacter sp. APW13]MDT8991341.1 DMT family transporter [Curvibacter sp. APW13]